MRDTTAHGWATRRFVGGPPARARHGWGTRRAAKPHLRIEMWGTRFGDGSDVGHRQSADMCPLPLMDISGNLVRGLFGSGPIPGF